MHIVRVVAHRSNEASGCCSRLRESFEGILSEAKGLQTRYLPEMQEKARTLNTARVLEMVRGR